MDIQSLLQAVLDRRRRLEIVRLVRVAPGPSWQIEPRCHDDSLIYLILSGACEGALDDRACRWQAGELWWVPPQVRHRFRPAGGQPLDMYVLRWHLACRAWPRRWLQVEDGLACRPAFDALLDAWHHPAVVHDGLQLRCALAQLLIAALDAAERPRSAGTGLTPLQRQRCYDLLAAHLADALAPEDLARACKLGPEHFRRRFKRSFGCSPRAWLARERIQHAAGLIRDAGLGIEQAARACGYESMPSFSRCFKRVMGMAPSAWR